MRNSLEFVGGDELTGVGLVLL